jgi:hypothetical protein
MVVKEEEVCCKSKVRGEQDERSRRKDGEGKRVSVDKSV